MTGDERSAGAQPTSVEQDWRELYLLGAIAAIVLVVVMILSVALFAIWPNAAGVTPTVELFALIRQNLLAGLIALDLGVTVGNLFSILMYLALYVALRQVNRSFALVALAFGLVAVTSVIAARPVAEILTLSNLFSTASDLEKPRYLAAGEAMIVLFHGTAFTTYILLGGLSLLISSWLMLRSRYFGKTVAYVGIVGNAISLGFLLPVVGPFFAFLSMLILAVWFILLARSFLRLRRQA